MFNENIYKLSYKYNNEKATNNETFRFYAEHMKSLIKNRQSYCAMYIKIYGFYICY